MKTYLTACLTLVLLFLFTACSTKKDTATQPAAEGAAVGEQVSAPPPEPIEQDILGEEATRTTSELPPEATTPAAPAITPAPRASTGYMSPLPPVSHGYPDYSTPSPRTGPSRVAPGGTYVVKRGDSLWSISRRHGTTVQALAEANNISPNAIIREGQRLVIPGGPAVSAAPTAAETGSGRTYRVQPGDSYYKIARKFGISTQKLMEYNNATSPTLRPGQVVRIP